MASRGARYKAPPIKVDAKVITSHRHVWTAGVGDLGPAHKQGIYADGSRAQKTVCGNWPGREVGVALQHNLCPVCFRDQSPSERTSK